MISPSISDTTRTRSLRWVAISASVSAIGIPVAATFSVPTAVSYVALPGVIIFTLMAWAAAGRQFSLTGTLHDALKASTPLVFGALGGILCERSGVINIAIEGFLLAGAFTSAVVGSVTNLWIGMFAAIGCASSDCNTFKRRSA